MSSLSLLISLMHRCGVKIFIFRILLFSFICSFHSLALLFIQVLFFVLSFVLSIINLFFIHLLFSFTLSFVLSFALSFIHSFFHAFVLLLFKSFFHLFFCSLSFTFVNFFFLSFFLSYLFHFLLLSLSLFRSFSHFPGQANITSQITEKSINTPESGMIWLTSVAQTVKFNTSD